MSLPVNLATRFVRQVDIPNSKHAIIFYLFFTNGNFSFFDVIVLSFIPSHTG